MPSSRGNTILHSFNLLGCSIIICDLKKLEHILNHELAVGDNDFFLADGNTQIHCYPLIRSLCSQAAEERLIVIQAGEGEKNISNVQYIWQRLQHGGAGRDSRLFILGGGMLTDIGGFAAATYMRGITFINMPTSLLGMTDAAIGGKTAVNLGGAKNQAGTFAFPEAVIIHPPFLRTLPKDELLAGYAEMVKTAIVGDRSLFEELLQINIHGMAGGVFVRALSDDIIMKSATLKAGICARDPFDRGIRQCLNFGHSVGHALEALYGGRGQLLRHGYAVAAGMVCEAWLAVQLAGLPVGQQQRIEDHLLASFPAVDYREEDLPEILHLMGYDKKNERGGLRLSLPESIGNCLSGVACPEALVLESLSHYLKIIKSRGL